MEFHIARSLRERLKLDEVLFSYTGNAIFANVAAARKLALGLNELRGQTADTAQSVHGAALHPLIYGVLRGYGRRRRGLLRQLFEVHGALPD